MNDPVLLYGASAALACVLLLGALEKLKDLAGFSRAVAAYEILPSSLSGAFARGLGARRWPCWCCWWRRWGWPTTWRAGTATSIAAAAAPPLGDATARRAAGCRGGWCCAMRCWRYGRHRC
ncbi:hypothetical protein G6F57_020330 [Rhizopus arrhizus]|nr:hypothetical protein G6F57_020330 [Rhizopus arrhizus]